MRAAADWTRWSGAMMLQVDLKWVTKNKRGNNETKNETHIWHRDVCVLHLMQSLPLVTTSLHGASASVRNLAAHQRFAIRRLTEWRVGRRFVGKLPIKFSKFSPSWGALAATFSASVEKQTRARNVVWLVAACRPWTVVGGARGCQLHRPLHCVFHM